MSAASEEEYLEEKMVAKKSKPRQKILQSVEEAVNKQVRAKDEKLKVTGMMD